MDNSNEGRVSTVAAEATFGRVLPSLDDGSGDSNLVSSFQVEAEATVSQFTKQTAGLQIWQLRSFGIVQENEKLNGPRARQLVRDKITADCTV